MGRRCGLHVDADGNIDGVSEVECGAPVLGYSSYCPRHEEETRLNRMIDLGAMAPQSIGWRDGDEQRIAARVLGDGIRGRRAVERALTRPLCERHRDAGGGGQSGMTTDGPRGQGEETMITTHAFHGQADDSHVCTCGKPQAYHHPRVMALGSALADPRVLNGTHEVRAKLSVGNVIIRKEGSMWNAMIPVRGFAWSPMRYVEIDRLARPATLDPIDFGLG